MILVADRRLESEGDNSPFTDKTISHSQKRVRIIVDEKQVGNFIFDWAAGALNPIDKIPQQEDHVRTANESKRSWTGRLYNFFNDFQLHTIL